MRTGVKTCLITGASRGIGRETALLLAERGEYGRLILNCRKNAAELEETRRLALGAGAVEVIASVGDVGDSAYVESLLREHGPADAVVNNAGTAYFGLLTDMTPAEWDEIIRTDLTSVFNTCRVFVPDMVSKKAGRILNISSVWGLTGASCEVAYSAAKAGVIGFTKALAKELAPSNIQVNAIAFGVVDTDMNGRLSDAEKASLYEEIPMGRAASAREAALAAVKLLEMPPYFTGETVKVDGGWQ